MPARRARNGAGYLINTVESSRCKQIKLVMGRVAREVRRVCRAIAWN